MSFLPHAHTDASGTPCHNVVGNAFSSAGNQYDRD